MVNYFFILKIVFILIGFIIFYSILQFLISIHPPRYYDYRTPSNYGFKYENVSFTTSDGIKIKAWLIKSEKANGTVIIGHGYPFDKGNIFPLAIFLYPDYNLLFYDHRYFGESEGKLSTAGYKEVEDVKAAVNFVKKNLGDKIALYGFSFSAAAMLMSKEKVNAIISDSPYANLKLMVDRIYSIFWIFKFPFVKITELLSGIFFGKYPHEISPALAIKNSTIPILLIHGEKDSQIPVENAYILKNSNPNIELWIVKNADHGQSYALNPEKYENKVKSFLKKYI